MTKSRKSAEQWEIGGPDHGLGRLRMIVIPGPVRLSQTEDKGKVVPCLEYNIAPVPLGKHPSYYKNEDHAFEVPKRYEDGIPAGYLSSPDFLDAGWSVEQRRPTDELLERFVALADAREEDRPDLILRFAKDWGPLWKCSAGHGSMCHWVPERWSHESRRPRYRLSEDKKTIPACTWDRKELLASWENEARRVRAILSIFGNLSKGKNSPPADWGSLNRGTKRLLPPHLLKDLIAREGDAGDSITELSEQRASSMIWFCSAAMNRALVLFGATLALEWVRADSEHGWKRNQWQPELAVDGGFGFLGLAWLEAARFVMDASRFYECSACKGVYPRFNRKPAGDRENYCPKCAKTGKGKQATWRAKTKGEMTPIRAGG